MLNHNIVILEALNDCSKYIEESRKEQVLKIIEEIQIIIDEPSCEDSIDGPIVRASYTANIIRTGKEPLN